MTDQARLTGALLVSILLHGLVLLSAGALQRVRLPDLPPVIDVDLAALPAVDARAAVAQPEEKPQAEVPPAPVLLPERQIVTPPDAGLEKDPGQTRLLSDRDNAVEQEMIRRGAGPAGRPDAEKDERAAPPASEPAAQDNQARREPRKGQPVAEPAAQERAEIAALPGLDRLLPLPGELSRSVPTPHAARAAVPESRNLLPGRRHVFSVSPGVSDFLPTIREGDITLLNTKAERFAPFVRRVAARVFQHLEINLKRAARQLRGGGAGREFATVEAVMNRRGELVRARLVERETNTQLAVYRELLAAARPDVFFDANPPPGAEAADGNIHFILLVDLMVHVGADPRTGAPSTGYYGMAGVGLDTAPR